MAKQAAHTVTAARVCVVATNVDELVIRNNPSEESVLGFVKEHMRRYFAGEAGGPGGHPAYFVKSATFYDDEYERTNPVEVDLSTVIPAAPTA